ncbi:hypothetical protein GF362_05765 [Candidatus Dojkabacteria bacterium]|nr:hypothetical protein [Candidatus Dojkabacteria bacterium]
MEQHPIPKNLMDVEFKLFGSMTLKEFGSLASCFVFALFIYLLKLPKIIAWPLIGALVVLGIGLAFIKVNGQTFGKWLTNFILALFSPKQRVWKKQPSIPKSFVQSFNVPKRIDKKKSRSRNVKDEIIFGTREDQHNKALSKYEKRIFSNINRYIGNDSMMSNFNNNVDTTRTEVDNRLKKQNISTQEDGAGDKIKNKVKVESNKQNSANQTGSKKQKEDQGNQQTDNKQGALNLIGGKVLDKNGQVCTDCEIIIQDGKYDPVRRIRINPNGMFSIQNGLPDGVYHVKVVSDNPDVRFKMVDIEVSGGENKIVTIKAE